MGTFHMPSYLYSEIEMALELENRIKEFRDIFDLFDKDGDGSISTKELETIMRSLGQSPTKKEIQEMVRMADNDDDGEINFDEFVTMISKKLGNLDIEEEVLEAFRVFDKDGNGGISKDELRKAMVTLGERVDETELDELVKLADVNNDGQINYGEFAKMIAKS